MTQRAPVYTYWSIIGMTLVALAVSHVLEIHADRAIWVFVGFMALGIPVGEFLERRAKRSKPS